MSIRERYIDRWIDIGNLYSAISSVHLRCARCTNNRANSIVFRVRLKASKPTDRSRNSVGSELSSRPSSQQQRKSDVSYLPSSQFCLSVVCLSSDIIMHDYSLYDYIMYIYIATVYCQISYLLAMTVKYRYRTRFGSP